MLATTLLRANFAEFFERFQKTLVDQQSGILSETDALWMLRALHAEITSANEKLRGLGAIPPDVLP